MPAAEPAERVVDRRDPGPHPAAALQLGLELGQREVGRRLDQPPEVGFVGREQRPAVAAIPGRCGATGRPTRCISLIAADGLTAKRWAAARIELPRSTARTMRSRRSMADHRHRANDQHLAQVAMSLFATRETR
jgi:hypothetical protein